MISHHAALVYTMVLVSAADNDMSDLELRVMGELVSFLPVFDDFDKELLGSAAAACAELLDKDSGLEDALALIRGALPEKLRETAYALACDVAAADGAAGQEELRMLELIRHRLEVDRLHAAAIERGSRARYARA